MTSSDDSTYQYMNGWDMIAGTKQKKLNEYLRLSPELHVTGEMIVLIGRDVKTSFDLIFRAPSISINETAGKQVNVNFPFYGKIEFGGIKTFEYPEKGYPHIVNAIVELKRFKSPSQDKNAKNKTTYDFVLDLKNKNTIVNYDQKDLNPIEIGIMVVTLKKILQDKVAEQHNYHIVSVTLDNDPVNVEQPFNPHVADVTFIKNNANPDNGNILVLMLTVNRKRGNIFFNYPVLPEKEDVILMINNHIFLQDMVYPKLVTNLIERAKHKNEIPTPVITSPNDASKELWTIHSTHDIDLDMENDPSINKFECKIDESKENLYLDLDAKSDKDYSFDPDNWLKAWRTVKNVNGRLTIGNQDQSNSAEIASTFLKGFGQTITNIIHETTNSIYLILNSAVSWPFQEHAAINEVILPGHIILTLNINAYPKNATTIFINELVSQTPELHSYIGKMAREAIVGKIQRSKDGSQTEPGHTQECEDEDPGRPQYCTQVEIFFPKHNAYEDDITTVLPVLDDKFWTDFSRALQKQSDPAAGGFNTKLHEHAFDWYKYVFSNQVYGYSPNQSTKDLYLEVVNSSFWIELKKLKYSQGQWENPEWEIFHHCVKLSCLGASDKEINQWLENCVKNGLVIPDTVGQNNWRNYLVWLIPENITNEDIDNKHKDSNTLYLKATREDLNFTVNSKPQHLV